MENPAVPLPARRPAVKKIKLLLDTTCAHRHKTTVSEAHAVFSAAVLPSRALSEAKNPKWDPNTVASKEPVDIILDLISELV